MISFYFLCDSDWIRTNGPQLRRLLLYPTELRNLVLYKSGWQDSNLRPPAPKAGAIAGLRYTPNLVSSAEKGGFEPPVPFPVRQFSKLLVSATHPSLRCFYMRAFPCKSTIRIISNFLFYLFKRDCKSTNFFNTTKHFFNFI